MDRNKLRQLLKLHEGLRLTTYKCPAGKLTIGIGRNLDDSPLTGRELEHLSDKDWLEIKDLRITEEEAYWLLDSYLDRWLPHLYKALPWIENLDDVRQVALGDLMYNFGLRGLLKLRHTLDAMRLGDFEWAANYLMSLRWYKQVRTRGPRIVAMVRTGQWPRELEEHHG